MEVLLLILIWVSIGYITGRFAEERGRSRATWFALGMLFGLFALAALFLLPSLAAKEKPAGKTDSYNNLPQMPEEPDFDVSWYYLDREDKQYGPVEFEELCVAWHDGVIGEETFVWCEGMESWKSIQDKEPLLAQLVKASANF